MSERGKYIVFEGLDGSGKTTQHQKLLERLGGNAIGVREPGGTVMAEKVRALIKNGHIDRSPRTNLYLLSAARADLIDQEIRPTIEADKSVVSDRNWLSTVAYQAGGEGVNLDEILTVTCEATQEFFEPDLTVFIDVPVEVCQRRMLLSEGRQGNDSFDSRSADFFETVRTAYLGHIRKFGKFAIVQGDRPIDEVAAEVFAAVQPVVSAAGPGGQTPKAFPLGA